MNNSPTQSQPSPQPPPRSVWERLRLPDQAPADLRAAADQWNRDAGDLAFGTVSLGARAVRIVAEAAQGAPVASIEASRQALRDDVLAAARRELELPGRRARIVADLKVYVDAAHLRLAASIEAREDELGKALAKLTGAESPDPEALNQLCQADAKRGRMIEEQLGLHRWQEPLPSRAEADRLADLQGWISAEFGMRLPGEAASS